MATFATRLAEQIALRGTTQAELARKAGVSASAVSDWMRGITSADNVKAEPLLKAAAYLQVHPFWLLTGKGASDPVSPTLLTTGESSNQRAKWPFERVPPDRYFALPEHVQVGIQMMVDGAVLGSTPPVKSTGTHG